MSLPLTTLEAVKRDLGISSLADDVLLREWILGVSGWIEDYCDQPILATTHEAVLDGNGSFLMVLPFSPVTAISYLRIGGRTISAATPGGTNYGYFLDSRGVLRLRGERFERGIGNIEISYTAGYAAVPEAVERAAVRMVGWRYRERDRLGASSKSIGGETISYQTAAASEDVLSVLAGYRRVVPA